MPNKKTADKAATKRGTSKKIASKKTVVEKQAPKIPKTPRRSEAELPSGPVTYIEQVKLPFEAPDLSEYLHDHTPVEIPARTLEVLHQHLGSLERDCDQRIAWETGLCNGPPTQNQTLHLEEGLTSTIRSVIDVLSSFGVREIILLLNHLPGETDPEWAIRLRWFALPALAVAINREPPQVPKLINRHLEELGSFIGSFDENNHSQAAEKCIQHSVSLCVGLLEAMSLNDTAEILKASFTLPELLRGNWTEYFRDIVVPKLQGCVERSLGREQIILSPMRKDPVIENPDTEETAHNLVRFSRDFKKVVFKGNSIVLVSSNSSNFHKRLSALFQQNSEDPDSWGESQTIFKFAKTHYNKERMLKDLKHAPTKLEQLKDTDPKQIASAKAIYDFFYEVIEESHEVTGGCDLYKFRLNPRYQYDKEPEPS